MKSVVLMLYFCVLFAKFLFVCLQESASSNSL